MLLIGSLDLSLLLCITLVLCYSLVPGSCWYMCTGCLWHEGLEREYLLHWWNDSYPPRPQKHKLWTALLYSTGVTSTTLGEGKISQLQCSLIIIKSLTNLASGTFSFHALIVDPWYLCFCISFVHTCAHIDSVSLWRMSTLAWESWRLWHRTAQWNHWRGWWLHVQYTTIARPYTQAMKMTHSMYIDIYNHVILCMYSVSHNYMYFL